MKLEAKEFAMQLAMYLTRNGQVPHLSVTFSDAYLTSRHDQVQVSNTKHATLFAIHNDTDVFFRLHPSDTYLTPICHLFDTYMTPI